MELKDKLQKIFNGDYPGTEVFIRDVICRIFGNEIKYKKLDLAEDTAYHDKAEKAGIKRLCYVADIVEQNYNAGKIALFDVTLDDRKNIERSRVNIQQLIRSVVQDYYHILMVFHYEDAEGKSWRFSYAYKQDTLANTTSAKRYTYVFGRDFRGRTAAERFCVLAQSERKDSDFVDAFSVEALSDNFFDRYRDIYADFVQYITGKRYEKIKNKWVEVKKEDPNTEIFSQFNNDDKRVRDYIKKMMGRLTFLCFLQRKGWMSNDRNFLQNLYQTSPLQDDFLDAVLEPLFFGVLNTHPENRKEVFAKNGWNVDLAEEWKEIPYLNGGLFEQTKEDKQTVKFEKELFQELFDFFGEYNFTIDENDPDDAEIGIDPEMLGRVFESLLEDNKDKGAFYTPKEIVQYMCRQSIIEYLKTHATESLHADIEDLINKGLVNHALQDKKTAREIHKHLKEVTVCDPAIGSGAFPMGILNILFTARQHLYGFLKESEPFNPLDIKKSIIRDNIYGVDIEQGAVDIARLRFWLAILVEEQVPTPLPNLDYKIMCGNSLLHRFALDAPFQQVFKDYNQKNGTNYTLDDYRQWVYNYTNISDHRQKDAFHKKIEEIKQAFKTELTDKEKGKIAKVRGTIANLQMEDLFGGKKKEAEKKIKILQKELKDLEQQRAEIESNKIYEQAFEWRFEFPALLDEDGKYVGFDIVIGNPPYISAPAQIADEQLAKQRKAIIASQEFKSLYQKWDLYIPFIEFGINHICKPNGLCTMIVPYPLTNQLYAKVLRKMIIASFDMFEIADLNGTKIFENATVSNCIPFIRKRKGGQTIISHINNEKTIKRSFVKEYGDLIQDENNYVWNLTQEERTGSRHPDFNVLGDYCYISVGMVLNADEKTAKGEFTKEDLISNRKDEIHPREYIEAKDIERYRIKNVRYLEYDTPRCPNKLRRPTFRELYNSDKLMFNRLGQLTVMLDNDIHYLQSDSSFIAVKWCDLINVNNKSISSSIKKFSCYTRKEMECFSREVDLRYLLGIMNSSYANTLLCDLRGGDYHIYPEHIRNIPITPATKEQQQPIIDLVDTILSAKRADANTDTSQEERKIDILVYRLYGLTYDEVKIIDPDTPITREEYNVNSI